MDQSSHDSRCLPFVLRGLRLLAWLQKERRDEPASVARYFDCVKCMKDTTTQDRQLIGCGYTSPAPLDLLARVRAWDHVGRIPARDELDDDGKIILQVCPGYACGLPEVTEASWAHSYWDKGELTQFCDGQPSTPMLRSAIGVIASEQNKVQAWEYAEQKRG